MEQKQDKPKLKMAVYWGAACGGCCVSVLDVHEKLFAVVAAADLVFWPIALDIKYKDVEAMPDGAIDITLFNGAVRNSENEHIAHLLRKKSKLLVAYGSCAHMGGIPGLANFWNKETIFKRVHTAGGTHQGNIDFRYICLFAKVFDGVIGFYQLKVRVNEGKVAQPFFNQRMPANDDIF